MPWYVLYTNPRSERKTAWRLEERGIKVYCPVREVVRQWSDRKKKVLEPLFRSYIFVHLDEYTQEQSRVLETPGAVRFLWWLGKPGIVRDEEIEAIESFLNSYRDVATNIHFREGAEVEVAEGVLQGKSGKVVKTQGNRISLFIESLGWNIIAELPAHVLKVPAKK